MDNMKRSVKVTERLKDFLDDYEKYEIGKIVNKKFILEYFLSMLKKNKYINSYVVKDNNRCSVSCDDISYVRSENTDMTDEEIKCLIFYFCEYIELVKYKLECFSKLLSNDIYIEFMRINGWFKDISFDCEKSMIIFFERMKKYIGISNIKLCNVNYYGEISILKSGKFQKNIKLRSGIKKKDLEMDNLFCEIKPYGEMVWVCVTPLNVVSDVFVGKKQIVNFFSMVGKFLSNKFESDSEGKDKELFGKLVLGKKLFRFMNDRTLAYDLISLYEKKIKNNKEISLYRYSRSSGDIKLIAEKNPLSSFIQKKINYYIENSFLNYDLLFINGEYYYLNSKAEKNKKWIVGKCKCKSTICYLEKNFKSTYVNSENCQLFIFSGQENSNEFIVCLCIVCEARYLSFNSYKGIKYLNDNSYPLFDHMSLTRVAHRSHRDAQKKLLGAASEKLVIEALGELGRQALDGYEYFYLLSCDKKETVLTNFFYFGFDGLFPESWTVNINDNDRIMIYSAIKDIEDLEVQGFFEYIGNVFNRNNKNVEFKSAVVTLLDIKNDRYVLIYLKKDAKSLHTNERTILETISPILEDTIRRIETHSDKDIISLNDRYHNTSFCCDYNFEIYLCRQVEYMAKMINASNGHIYLYDCVSNLLYYAGGFKVNEDQIENNTYLEVDSNSLVAQAIDSGSSIFSKLYSGEYFLVNGSKVPYNFLLDLDEAISIPIHDEKNKRNLWGVVTFGFESNKANKENVEKVVSDYEHFMTAEYCDILNIKSYQLESLLKDVLLNLSLGASYLTKRAFDEICSAIASVSKCESVSIRIYDLISNCLVRKGGYGPESMQSSLYAEPLDSVSSYAFNNYKIYNSIYIPNTKERSSYSKLNFRRRKISLTC